MININRKKRGSSYVEVIMILVLCAIIITGVLKGIAFTSSAERKENQGLNSRLLLSDIYEEIKGISNKEFQVFLNSMKEENEYPLLYDDINEVTQRDDKSKFRINGEEFNEFKVYQKRDSNIYIKVSFPRINYKEESMGMEFGYGIHGESVQNPGNWITQEDCDMSLLLEESVGESGYYINIIKENTGEKNKFFIESESPVIELILDSRGISIVCNESLKYNRILSKEEENIFLKETLNRKINFILKNLTEEKGLSIFVDQSNDAKNNTFNIYGERIEVHRNNTEKNPFGESYKFTLISRMRIQVFSLEDNVLMKIEDLDGYKKFERFGQ